MNQLVCRGDYYPPEEGAQIEWTVPMTLQDNTYYYWRVRARSIEPFSGNVAVSEWAYGNFFVNLF